MFKDYDPETEERVTLVDLALSLDAKRKRLAELNAEIEKIEANIVAELAPNGVPDTGITSIVGPFNMSIDVREVVKWDSEALKTMTDAEVVRAVKLTCSIPADAYRKMSATAKATVDSARNVGKTRPIITLKENCE